MLADLMSSAIGIINGDNFRRLDTGTVVCRWRNSKKKEITCKKATFPKPITQANCCGLLCKDISIVVLSRDNYDKMPVQYNVLFHGCKNEKNSDEKI